MVILVRVKSGFEPPLYLRDTSFFRLQSITNIAGITVGESCQYFVIVAADWFTVLLSGTVNGMRLRRWMMVLPGA